MQSVRFTIIDTSGSLVAACGHAFKQHLSEPVLSRFTLKQSKLSQLQPPDSLFDCIVSPANSYGRLDGGFDYYISKALSPSNDFLAVTRLAQLYLYRRWRGYAPPATCTLVPLQGTVCEENPHGCSFIALCPTMRIPENVTWHRDLVYNCVWSLLVAVDEHNRTVDETGAGTKIQKMLMTGLATGSGGVSVDQCAQQMALAFRDFENALDDPDKWQALEWPDAIAMARECGKTNKSENRLAAGRFTPRWTRIVFLIAVLTLCYPVLSKWRQSIV